MPRYVRWLPLPKMHFKSVKQARKNRKHFLKTLQHEAELLSKTCWRPHCGFKVWPAFSSKSALALSPLHGKYRFKFIHGKSNWTLPLKNFSCKAKNSVHVYRCCASFIRDFDVANQYSCISWHLNLLLRKTSWASTMYNSVRNMCQSWKPSENPKRCSNGRQPVYLKPKIAMRLFLESDVVLSCIGFESRKASRKRSWHLGILIGAQNWT